ncbi:MAG TPA: hypothetical protein VES67_06400 [Vicinamibacterales bacterium]|nr:hypothetical protein [Vicinamibacterales bacterium]
MARQDRDNNIVDLLRFRNTRRRDQPLPLFDTPAEPRLVTITPFRVLSAREVSHRARMLHHLKTGTSKFKLRTSN